VMEALIVRSIEEGARRGIVEVSLGVAPRVIPAGDTPGPTDRALKAMFWGLDRFERSRTLYQFKAKFNPCWEDRFLATPGASTLPEVLVALVRAHIPPLSASTLWVRSAVGSVLRRPGVSRPSVA
jgi:lysylphosphatidylglycerol synthetase-like protein (DUF2156 family)